MIDESRAPNSATVFVMLAHWDDRPTRDLWLGGILRNVNAQFGQIQEANVIGFPVPSLPGLGVSGSLDAVRSGQAA